MPDHHHDRISTRPVRLRRSILGWLYDERGSVSVTVALSMTAMLAFMALGIDLGALLNARSEAQRAADAAALAGASAFLDYQQDQARSEAIRRAMDFATSNDIRNEPILPEDVQIWVDTDSATVRTAIRRGGVSTWFARIFGVHEVNVRAEATAWAGAAGAAQCVKPFAVPDMWEETTDDVNGNRLWDDDERWRYEPGNGDRYVRYNGPDGGPNETGYGSDWRDGMVDGTGRHYDRDYGRRITIKVTDPRNAYVPSFFLPWVLPIDPEQPDCGSRPGGPNSGGNGGGSGGTGGGGDGGSGPGGPPDDTGNGGGWLKWQEKRQDLGGAGGQGPGGPNGGGNGGGTGGGGGGVGQDDGEGRGAARYRQNICSCNSSIIDLDTEYLIEPGNMVGPTFQGVQQLIAADPDARWDSRSNSVVSEYGMESPRVVTVALFDPGEITMPGRQYLRFNNFARVFIEEQASRQDAVTGRFLYYVRGAGLRGRSGETKGSLVRVLQLIR